MSTAASWQTRAVRGWRAAARSREARCARDFSGSFPLSADWGDPARALGAHVQVPANVATVLRRACADCHSNETHWPWYSQVAPVSWLVAGDVRDGRRHVNFSDWNQLDRRGHPKDTKKQLEKICEEVSDGGMPITAYKLIHRDAGLSAEDEKAICDWTKGEVQRLKPRGK